MSDHTLLEVLAKDGDKFTWSRGNMRQSYQSTKAAISMAAQGIDPGFFYMFPSAYPHRFPPPPVSSLNHTPVPTVKRRVWCRSNIQHISPASGKCGALDMAAEGQLPGYAPGLFRHQNLSKAKVPAHFPSCVGRARRLPPPQQVMPYTNRGYIKLRKIIPVLAKSLLVTRVVGSWEREGKSSGRLEEELRRKRYRRVWIQRRIRHVDPHLSRLLSWL